MKPFFTLLSLFLLSALSAQKIEISIENSDREAIAFATVQNQETKKTSAANSNGVIYHTLENNIDTLIITAVGYDAQTIYIQDNDSLQYTVTMVEAFQSLESINIRAKRINPFGFDRKSLAASSVVLDRKSLDRIPSTDINQVLYTVPGVQIQQEDGFGLRPNIGMRGTGTERSSKITLMEDGVLIAPAPYSASAAYYFPSMDHIENIEILKGSSQIAYGPQTNGGALNLISDNITNDFTGRFKASYGRFQSRKVQASVSDTKGKIGYLVKGTFFDSQGFKELPQNQNTGFNRGDYLAKLSFTTNESAKMPQSFLVKIAYTNERSNETYLGITEEDFNVNPIMRYAASQFDNIQSTHSQIMLDHSIEPINNVLISSQVYLNQFSRNWYKLDKASWNGEEDISISSILSSPDIYSNELLLLKGNPLDVNNSLSLKNNNRAYTAKGIQSRLFYKSEGKKVSHYLQGGFRLHADEMDRYQWNDSYSFTDSDLSLVNAGTPGTESNRIESAEAAALFAQYKLSVGKFRIEPGLRFEHINFNRTDYGKEDTERTGKDLSLQDNTNTVILPGISVQYNVKNRNYLFVGVHKGFSPSNYRQETMPESSWNTEVGMKGISNGFGYEAIFFSNDYQNLLGSDLAASGGVGTTELYNGGEAYVWGFESLVSYNLLRGKSENFILPFTVAYTYTNAQFKNEFESNGPWGEVAVNDFFPYVARHQVSAQLGLEHKRFVVNTLFKLVSPRFISPNQGNFTSTNSIPMFHQLDIMANYKVQKNSTVFLKMNNVTNHIQRIAFHPAGWRPNMPFYMEGGFELNF